MTKINVILADEAYRSAMEKIEYFEKERAFCRHGLSHSLDVARIAWIYCLENKLSLDREVVYAAALVHDIGRSAEYETGEDHDRAGVRLCRPILCKAGFSPAEQEVICASIAGHRQSRKDRSMSEKAGWTNKEAVQTNREAEPMNKEAVRADMLAALLYKADKQSRLCFMCGARSDCYWDETKKNKTLNA